MQCDAGTPLLGLQCGASSQAGMVPCRSKRSAAQTFHRVCRAVHDMRHHSHVLVRMQDNGSCACLHTGQRIVCVSACRSADRVRVRMQVNGSCACAHAGQRIVSVSACRSTDRVRVCLQVNEHHLLGFGTTGCVYAGQYTPSPGEAVPVAVKLMSDAYEARQMLFLDAHARSACQPLVDFRRVRGHRCKDGTASHGQGPGAAGALPYLAACAAQTSCSAQAEAAGASVVSAWATTRCTALMH